MGSKLQGLKPELLWKHFEEICNRPHPSRKEELLSEYVIEVAKRNNLEVIKDGFGNVIVKKNATKGLENLPVTVLQGHLDMVGEKNSDVPHDFDKDPIQAFVDDGWVKARGTTLGADNGIGVAAALSVMEDKDVQHGPLEFLFTLDEETGLNGAGNLDTSVLKASTLINMDSEEDGALYIGCAGGKNTYVKFVYAAEDALSDSVAYEIKVTGLKGGHSGLDINEGRGNAIKLIVRLLWSLSKKYFLQLEKINGGSKHNAIPRECFATIVVPLKSESDVVDYVSKYNSIVKKELATKEPGLKVEAIKTNSLEKVIDVKTTTNLFNSLYAIPNGVINMSPDIQGLVQTSTNLAIVATDESAISVTTSQRSSVESEKDDIADVISASFNLANAEVSQGDGYPGWNPNVNSPILKKFKSIYENLYGNEPEVKAIHAGLECGIINEKYPGMDMISFGPTIMGAHSPDERVKIDTVEKFWTILKAVLKAA